MICCIKYVKIIAITMVYFQSSGSLNIDLQFSIKVIVSRPFLDVHYLDFSFHRCLWT